MKMRLFTLVWGNPYIDWFEHALCASLKWGDNLTALAEYAVEWNIYCRDAERERLRAVAEPLGVPLQFHPFDTRNSSGETLQPALLDHMRNCLQTGCAAFLAPPDTIFGSGSVAAICEVGRLPGLVVTVPHVRVNAGCLPRLGGVEWRNAPLVDFAFENLHATWRDANADLQNTNAHLGGVSWRAVRRGLYAVTHRLPTPYLIGVNAGDVEWLSRQSDTGTIDHTFPAKVAKEQRLRNIASSDAAFICELTREHENIPPLFPADPNEPDKYFRDLEHHYVNRTAVAFFRGESAGV